MKPMFNMLNNISLSFVFVFRPLEHLNWQDKILCFYLSRHPKKVSNVALIINIRDWLFNVLISVVCCQLNNMSHGKDNFPSWDPSASRWPAGTRVNIFTISQPSSRIFHSLFDPPALLIGNFLSACLHALSKSEEVQTQHQAERRGIKIWTLGLKKSFCLN